MLLDFGFPVLTRVLTPLTGSHTGFQQELFGGPGRLGLGLSALW